MTLVTAALARIARQVSVAEPSSWLTATQAEHVEIRDDFMPETAADILSRFDLPAPISATFDLTGTGVETYSLPSAFLRMQRDRLAVYETGGTRRAVLPVTTAGEYAYLKDLGATGGQRYYRVTGYEGSWSISIYRAPEAGTTFKVQYVTDQWIGGTTGNKAEFNDASDVLLLPRRVMELGTVLRWRERRGLPIEGVDKQYETEIARLGNDRSGVRSVYFGEAVGARQPWDVPVPDYIPES